MFMKRGALDGDRGSSSAGGASSTAVPSYGRHGPSASTGFGRHAAGGMRPGSAGGPSFNNRPGSSGGASPAGGSMGYFRPSVGPGAGRTTTSAPGSFGARRPGSAGPLGDDPVDAGGESRSVMMERQRQLQRDRLRKRMGGGMMMTSRPTERPGTGHKPLSFSAPRSAPDESDASGRPGSRGFGDAGGGPAGNAPHGRPDSRGMGMGGPMGSSMGGGLSPSGSMGGPSMGGGSMGGPSMGGGSMGGGSMGGPTGGPSAGGRGGYPHGSTAGPDGRGPAGGGMSNMSPPRGSRGHSDRFKGPTADIGGGGSSDPAEPASSAVADAIRERERRRAAEAVTAKAEKGDDESASRVGRDLKARGLEGSYEPPSVARGTGGVSVSRGVADGKVTLDFTDMHAFLTTPTPKGVGIVQCYIERDKSGMGKRLYPLYQLYMKDGDRFLLSGKKRSGQKTSNYLISSSKTDLNRKSSAFLGKLRSNFVGTEFTVYDDGLNPKDALKAHDTSKAREELAIVNYASNVLGARGPRKMKVSIPKVGLDGRRATFRPTSAEEDDTMMAKFKAGHVGDMITMINKPPKWNEQVGAYVLNFNGRVTMASVKNFQLVTPDEHEAVLLQFGRVGKDLFTMDYQWPLSPLQAFGICLSSFDYKLACE